MDKTIEQSVGDLIDTCYKQQVSKIDLQSALEGFIKDDDTNASMAFRNLYREDDHCDIHNLDFNVEINWDGITVTFLLKITHADFNAKIRYQSERLEDYSMQILVLLQGDNLGFSAPVVFRCKAQCAGNGLSPCQALQRRSGTPQERPAGWPVSAHGGVAPLAKDYGHSLQGAPCHER